MDWRAFPLRIGGPAAASLLVNALLVAALLNLGMGRRASRVETAALTVMELAVTKGAETGEQEAPAAASAPVVAMPAPQQPLTDQAFKADPAPADPPPVALPSVLAATISSPVRAAPVAAVPAPPSPERKGVADELDVKAPAGTSRSYAAKIRSWLYAHKIYPRRARMRHEEGSVQVRFVLDRAGMLVEGMILRGSGHNALDEEAMAMMRRASPFPKAPSDLPGERIEFTAPIDFILPA